MKAKKQMIRERIWALMEERSLARFPIPCYGRIPNFIGAEEAAKKALELEEFRNAKVIKANPDSPQRPLRELCLKTGKVVYMAVPRLRGEKCFIELDPKVLKGLEAEASSIKGAFKLGKPVAPWEMRRIDLMIVGCVAVNKMGVKLGKSGGYSDLEFAIGREYGLISETTPIITTVHPAQLIEEEIPMERHDVPVDYIITPEEIIRTERFYPRPKGIYWDILSEEKIATIPLLQKLKGQLKN